VSTLAPRVRAIGRLDNSSAAGRRRADPPATPRPPTAMSGPSRRPRIPAAPVPLRPLPMVRRAPPHPRLEHVGHHEGGHRVSNGRPGGFADCARTSLETVGALLVLGRPGPSIQAKISSGPVASCSRQVASSRREPCTAPVGDLQFSLGRSRQAATTSAICAGSRAPSLAGLDHQRGVGPNSPTSSAALRRRRPGGPGIGGHLGRASGAWIVVLLRGLHHLPTTRR